MHISVSILLKVGTQIKITGPYNQKSKSALYHMQARSYTLYIFGASVHIHAKLAGAVQCKDPGDMCIHGEEALLALD